MKDFENIRSIQEDELEHGDLPPLNSRWKHYKGGIYIVRSYSMRESDLAILIHYDNEEHPMPIPWSRPLNDWNDKVFVESPLEDHYFKIPRYKLLL